MPSGDGFGDAADLPSEAEIVVVGTEAVSVRDPDIEDAEGETDEHHPERRMGPAIVRRGDAGGGPPIMGRKCRTHQKTASFVSETGGKRQLTGQQIGCADNHRRVVTEITDRWDIKP